ncbi:hypothetical protein QFZ84_003268 [Pseudomonas fluorescens]
MIVAVSDKNYFELRHGLYNVTYLQSPALKFRGGTLLGTRGGRGAVTGFIRRQVSAPFNYPHQMELVCNKAFDHEFE